MSKGRVLLKDEFEFQTVPFIVKVEVVERFVNAKTRELSKVCYDRTPQGYSRTPREWVICDLILCRVRPNYPYTIDKEWPENVDKHFHTVVPLESPARMWKWKFFPTYTAESVKTVEDVDETAVAKQTIAKMKKAYENRAEVSALEC